MTDALARDQIVEAVLRRFADEHDSGRAEPTDPLYNVGSPPVRDQLLAEVYATIFRLDGALELLAAKGPGGILRMIAGVSRSSRKERYDTEEQSKAEAAQEAEAATQ